MDTDDLEFFVDVVHEVMDEGLAPSLRHIASHLSPKGRELEIMNALQLLVADGRLVKVGAILSFDGNDHATDLDLFYPASPHRSGSGTACVVDQPAH